MVFFLVSFCRCVCENIYENIEPSNDLTGEIVLEAENSVCVDHDVTRHAELNLVSLASKKFGLFEKQNFISISLTSPLSLSLSHTHRTILSGKMYFVYKH